ncbi:hypothetical protein FB567DRAFT_237058 [Paraphoma chrysanthemicola]|uniref:Uncharacterized protein n=1 Tax=Paraphoma chrysanthemicola TaxID=798071 RepID=A0A8K0RE14_9PLEO|nr:hypothetical protein FB567DRAFT_237058 [Paraphoma chrysanthemicola]
MPPYNPHMRTKSHSQVLKNRLADIADHITSYLGQSVPENMRGLVELRIYRYIADHYWPLPVTPSTHLDILRIGQNMTFSQTTYTEVAEARQAHEQWADEFRERLCEGFGESFGEAAARCFAARNKTTAVVGEANGTKLWNELVQDQEAMPQGHAHHSAPSMSQPWDDTTDPLVATAKATLHAVESPMPSINKALEIERTIDPRLLDNVEYDIGEGDIEELDPYGYDPVSITSAHNQSVGNTTFLQPTVDDDSHHMNALYHPERDLPAPLVSSNNDANLNDDYKIAIRMAQGVWDGSDNTSTLHGGDSRTPVDDAILTPEQQIQMDAEYAERLQSEEYGGESSYAGGATAAWRNSKAAVRRRLGAVSHRLGAMPNGAGNAGENLDQDVLFPDGDEEMDKDC